VGLGLLALNWALSKNMLNGASILITGGTGSFGHTFIPTTLENTIQSRLLYALEMK
jgi:FlaA1/EpsC-like NDP-sugar epimerase